MGSRSQKANRQQVATNDFGKLVWAWHLFCNFQQACIFVLLCGVPYDGANWHLTEPGPCGSMRAGKAEFLAVAACFASCLRGHLLVRR